MLYKCLECGNIFGCDEIAEWSETHAELNISSLEEKMDGCPICHGKYEEVNACAICGGLYAEDELNCGVCDDCIDSYRFDFDKCYNVSFGEYEDVKINALIASVLDCGDINAILLEYIKSNLPNVDCSSFIDYDKEWFAEQILKENYKMSNQNKKEIRSNCIALMVSENEREEIEKVAQDMGISLSAVVRFAVKKYIKEIYKLNQ